MSPRAVVWIVVGVLFVVILALAGVQVARAAREAKRARRRIEGYRESPAAQAALRARGDVERLSAATAAAGELATRAETAVDVIRRGPLPPELFVALAWIRRVFADFRAAVTLRYGVVSSSASGGSHDQPKP